MMPMTTPVHTIWPITPSPLANALIAAGGAVGLAIVVHAVVYLLLHRATRRTPGVADSAAVRRTRGPALVLAVLVAGRLVLPAMPAPEETLSQIGHAVTVAIILCVTWLVVQAVAVIDDVILSRYRVDVRDNLQARRVHTQTKILSRTAMFLVGLIGVASALMTFPAIRQLGTSILTSAGLVGLIIGLAARPTIGNFIAGLQLALTQPIRLDDVVIVKGEWGRIEQITTTYVVMRIWDQRRLIVPLQHFIEEPFENWTRQTAEITGSIFLHVDYTVPVEAVRRKLREIVESAEEWDGKTCVLQVTDTSERTMTLRALVSAADSSRAWDLRCLVRERLLEFIREEHPQSMPRLRTELLEAR